MDVLLFINTDMILESDSLNLANLETLLLSHMVDSIVYN